MKAKVFLESLLPLSVEARSHSDEQAAVVSVNKARSRYKNFFFNPYSLPDPASASFASEFFVSGDKSVRAVEVQDASGLSFYGSSGSADEAMRSRLELNDYLHVFKRTARSDSLEYGAVSRCDDLISRWSSEIPDQIGGIINHIFLRSISDKNVLLSLLKAISNLTYKSIYPFGQTIAVAALVNRDVEVVEAGIRAFENWGDRDGISVLESASLVHGWLDVYRQQTLVYLRES